MKKLRERKDFLKGLAEDSYYSYFGLNDDDMQAFEDTIDWSDFKTVKKLFNTAKSNPKSNEAKLLLWAGRFMALRMLFVFLGPNPEMQKRRIDNGDDMAFYSYCYEAFINALESWNIDKFKDEPDLRRAIHKGFPYWYCCYLVNLTKRINKRSMKTEKNEISADQVESYKDREDTESLDDLVDHPVWDEESFVGDEQSFVQFLKDPFLRNHIGKTNYTYFEAFERLLLKRQSINQIADAMGVSKNTIRANFQEVLPLLREKYELDIGRLADLLHSNPDFYAEAFRRQEEALGLHIADDEDYYEDDELAM